MANKGKLQAEAAMEATISSLDASLSGATAELARVRALLKQEREEKVWSCLICLHLVCSPFGLEIGFYGEGAGVFPAGRK